MSELDGAGAPLSSAVRTLTLLQVLAQDRRIRVHEVADLLEISRPAAHRLITTLVHEGFAVRDDHTSAYLAGPQLTELARRAHVADEVRERAAVALRMLVDELDETLHFAVRQGNGMLFIDGVAGRVAPAGEVRVGLLLPAHATAAGKAVLSGLEPDAVRALYPRGLMALTPLSHHTVDDLLQDLAAVRARGYALNMQESELGVSGIAVRTTGGPAGQSGALVLTAPSSRLGTPRIDRIVPRLQRACDVLSR